MKSRFREQQNNCWPAATQRTFATIQGWTKTLVMKTRFAEAGYSKSKEEVEGCQRRERRKERRAGRRSPSTAGTKRNFERGVTVPNG